MRKASEWWSRWMHRVLGSILLILAFCVIVYTAGASSRTEPPSGELSVSLVVLTGILQLGSVAMFAKSGKPDEVHAAASARRLVNLTIRTQALSRAAEQAKGQDVASMRVALTEMSARLNYIAEDTFASVEDWTSFNHAAQIKVAELDDRAASEAITDLPEGACR